MNNENDTGVTDAMRNENDTGVTDNISNADATGVTDDISITGVPATFRMEAKDHTDVADSIDTWERIANTFISLIGTKPTAERIEELVKWKTEIPDLITALKDKSLSGTVHYLFTLYEKTLEYIQTRSLTEYGGHVIDEIRKIPISDTNIGMSYPDRMEREYMFLRSELGVLGCYVSTRAIVQPILADIHLIILLKKSKSI